MSATDLLLPAPAPAASGEGRQGRGAGEPGGSASRRPRRAWSARSLQALLALALLLPAIALAAVLVLRYADAERDRLERAGAEAARAVAAAVERELAALQGTLEALATSPALAAGDLAAFHAQASRLRMATGTEYVVAEPGDGRQLANTRVPWGAPLPRVASPSLDVIREAAAGGGALAVSGIFRGAVAGRAVVAAAVPARLGPDGRPVALAASTDGERLWSELLARAGPRLGEGWIATVADGSGIIVARAPEPGRFVGTPLVAGFRERLAAETAGTGAPSSGWIRGARTRDGQAVQVAWHRLGPAAPGWTALVAVPGEAFAAPLRQAVWPLVGGGAALLGLGLALALVAARRLTGPLEALAAAGAREAPPPRSGVLEVDRLADALAGAEAGRAANEAALRGSEARFRAAFEAAAVGMAVLDEALAVAEANPAFCAIVGRGADEVVGRPCAGFTHPDDLPGSARLLGEVAEGRAASAGFEKRYVRPDGAEVWVRVSATRLGGRGGGPARSLLAIVEDVSARVAAEAALRASEARLRRVQRIGRVGGFEIDLRTGANRRSAEYMQIQGLAAREAAERHEDWVRRLHPEDRERAERRFLDAVADGAPDTEYAQEYRVVTPAGEARWVAARAEIERDPETGRALRMLGAHVDVTELKAAEAALAASESRLALALQGTSDGLWDWDVARGEVHHSPRFAEMLGYAPGEWESTYENWRGHMHPDDVAPTEEALRRYLAREAPDYAPVFRMRHRDGSWRWMLSRAKATWDAGGRPVRMVGAHTDVTAQKLAEDALRASEARLRAVLDGITEGFVVLDRGFRVTGINAEGLRIDGRPAGEILGRTHWEAWPASAGTPVEAAYRKAMAERVPVALEHRFGGEGRGVWLDIRAFPVPEGIAVLYRDVTGRKRAEEVLARDREGLGRLVEERTAALLRAAEERRRAEEAMRQSEKLAALGQLTGGVAHDFNNLLQVVSSGAALLKRPGLSEARRAMVLDGMIGAGQAARGLTGRLLAFARRQALAPETLDLNARLLGLSELLRQTLGSAVRVETELAADLWPVHCDPGGLEVALLNLAANARDAMPSGGALRLRTRNAALGAAGERAAGDYVVLEVEDTGEGMPPAVLARVFEPFFTTKEAGRGTGLGLPQVFGFARQSGGDIRIESEPGRGTTVAVLLPRAAAAAAAPSAAPPAAPPRAGGAVLDALRSSAGRTVLVVEDNREAGDFAAALLEELGYATVRAGGAAEALALLADGARVDAVFSDVVMPGGAGGLELAAALRASHPGVALVLTTGYSAKLADGDAPEGVEVLAKPYLLDELAAALGRALAAAQA